MIRGWCPSLHEPMATGDGLLVRVKPRGGVLGGAQARLIAREAAARGNGVVELTSRGNLQVRGLSPASAGGFAAAMVAAGLASACPAAERRRNVTATPLSGLDPAIHPSVGTVTAALERTLEADALLAGLPAKFGFLVDGGGVLPLAAAPRDDAASAYVRLLLVDDRTAIVSDAATTVTVPLGDAVAAALALARASIAPVSLSSWPDLIRPSALPTEMAAFDFGRGEAMDGRVKPGHDEHVVSAGESRNAGGRGPGNAIGEIGSIALGAGLAFGGADASVWLALAELAERHGDGRIWLTPWRAVLIAGTDPALPAALATLGLITDPDDPRLRVAACSGAPACGSATVATRSLAARLRPAPGGVVHVSGCEKGCAHPGAASLTLVGREGRFDLVRNGRAGDTPERRGLSVSEVLAL